MQVLLNETKNVSASKVTSENTYGNAVGKQWNVSTNCRRMDFFAYGNGNERNLFGMNNRRGQGMTVEEIQSFLSAFDVDTYQDRMTMLSNSVSSKDLGKMYENGFSASTTEVEEYVTVLDQIKLTEAKAGKVIAGYNDQLSGDMIEEATGSISLASVIKNELRKAGLPVTRETVKQITTAVSQASELEKPSPATKKYLVENLLPPTIGNLFSAQFSGSISGKQQESYFEEDASGYLYRMSGIQNPDEFKNEIRQLLENNAIPVTEDTQKTAGWLMREGICVSQKTMKLAAMIEQAELPETTKELVEKLVNSLKEGIEPKNLDFSGTESLTEMAIRYEERAKSVSEHALLEVVERNLPLTLQSLEYCQGILKADNQEGLSFGQKKQEGAQELVTARRQLEEFRLYMTARAGLTLLKAGVSIDTTELSRLVDSLKEIERNTAKALFPNQDEEKALSLQKNFEETRKLVEELPRMPLSMVGAAVVRKADVTLTDYYEEGNQARMRMQAAKESYETYMTVVRADLGDNIENAFSNIPFMLKEAGIEPTKENTRAARILGYNHLEITQESLEAVKEADGKLNYVLNELNPAMILKLIREGHNPLNMDMDTLIEQIDEYQDSPETEHMRFSHFLYGLDRKQEITPKERKAFLEVYRVLKQVEKTNGAPIGALLATEGDLTLSHLKQSFQASKKKLDYAVADGDIETKRFLRDVKSVSHRLSAAAIEKALAGKASLEQVSLNDLKAAVEETDMSGESALYGKELHETMQQAADVPDEIVQKIMELQLDVTFENVVAMRHISENRGELFRQYEAMLKNGRLEKTEVSGDKEDLSSVFLDEIEDFPESLSAETPFESIYGDFLEEMQDSIMKSIENADGYIDIRQMLNLSKQVGILQRMQKQKEYEIPMILRGELTSVHVSLRGNEQQKGNVTVTTVLPNGTKLGASFQMKDGEISGLVVSDSKTETQQLKEKIETMKETLSKEQIGYRQIEVVYSAECNLSGMEEEGFVKEKADVHKLYQVAKAFLTCL